ncbi:PGF-CTERM-anchored ABC transporter substrate-binding protein [Natrialbaceae archaeon A-arb3/5]
MRPRRTILIGVILLVAASALAPGGVVTAQDTTTDAPLSHSPGHITTDAPLSTSASTQAIDANCEYPLERTDARGEQVTIEDEPDEVVALYPGDAQLAFEIGAEDRVVGMPIGPFTDSLDAGDRTDITEDDGVTPVAEEIVALDPDVVIAANIADEDLVSQLEDAGITVYVHETATSIDDVRENVEATGELTGECDGAEDAVAWMDERLDVVETALEDADEPLAYYVSDDEGTTPGTETFQHEILTAAGLENVAERAGIEGWQEISAEVVVAEDPDWIVYPDWTDEPPVAESIEETTAMQEDNVVAVDDNAVSQPAPGIVHVVEHLVETVHPDVYDEIEDDLEAVDEEHGVDGGVGADASDDDDGESDSTDEAGADDDGAGDDGAFAIPGFGVVGAIVALLVVAATRRVR